ncbi:MAG: DUF3418 domain-containing protein [Actinomycetaceae bacterium]|nr:DUF3418 domain-containing protein [Actinomycetaceae bacterium]MDY5273105.1 DUF3418 domain-containing protein [Arcanobacterium sp.]
MSVGEKGDKKAFKSSERNGAIASRAATSKTPKSGNRSRSSRRHSHRSQHRSWRGFSSEQLELRRRAVPTITYPEELPVSARREEIKRAIKYSQVVIVAGETGSGKTTQIPKMCLELGLGITGMIGHTQPRRIAARSVAERISDELGVELGGAIGYQVRFTDRASDSTLVKLMTDGILLAEIQSDPQLRKYSALIIDEAHERSLNIDFLLGYLARLLPQRPDLKLIITSATIDSERFAAHFGEHMYGGFPGNKAPIIEVSGRTYPVEIRYRPLFDDDAVTPSTGGMRDAERIARSETGGDFGTTAGRDGRNASAHGYSNADVTTGIGIGRENERPTAQDQTSAIVDAAHELFAEGSGDILVFLSGEGEIHETQKAFHDDLGVRYIEPGGRSSIPDAVEVVPLFARLSAAEQHRIFEPHQHRRIVLATNIAETSLTVPGIRYVIDPGTARISRFSNKTKVQRLPIEAISQASANQRSGRCGRVADGIAIRLYSHSDFESRPEFTEPEIQRTSLAAVILQMASLHLGAVEDFPFIDPPDIRAVRAGVQLLEEIGALEPAPPGRRQASHQQPTELAGKHSARSDAAHSETSGNSKIAPLSAALPSAAASSVASSSPAAHLENSNSASPSATPAPYRLTKIGRELARLPIDPRLGRMLLAGADNGAAAEVLVLVAAMSVQDVRERPADFKAQADQLHARFTEPHSDFLAYLNLWRYLSTQQRELSGSAFRRLCKAEFINWLRWREWQDVVTQLRELAQPLHLHLRPITLPSAARIREAEEELLRTAADTSHHRAVIAAVKAVGKGSDTPAANAIHRSLLVGLLSNIGSWDERKRDYEGARGTHFVIWPGSGLNRKHHPWVMAAELVETSRLFARSAARIEPEWIEPIAKHLVKRTYSEPFWSAKHGAAMVHERVTLYGLTVTPDRVILASSLGTAAARELARELFIRCALVDNQWRGSHHAFVRHNAAEVEKAHEVETRLRQFGLVADDAAQFTFFDERIPENILSARDFDKWWKNERQRHPHLLDFTQDFLLGTTAAASSDFPDEWRQGTISLPITYTFNPGGHADGITIDIPVTVLPQVRDVGFDWLVPGMLPELVTATIRALPKRIRRNLVPAPDAARDILALFSQNFSQNSSSGGATSQPSTAARPSFHAAFSAAVTKLRGVHIDDSAWDEAQAAMPAHLQVTFVVRSERGAVLDESTSITALQHDLAPQSRSAVQSVMASAVSQALDEARDRIVADQKAAQRAQEKAAAAQARRERSELAERASAAKLSDSIDDLHTWPVLSSGELPEVIETMGANGMAIRGYPALVEVQGGTASPASGTTTPAGVSTVSTASTVGATAAANATSADRASTMSVALRVLTSAAEQQRDHRHGVIRLLANELLLPQSRIVTRWNARESLALAASPYPNTSALSADMQFAATRNVAQRWAREHKQPLGTLRRQADYEQLRAYTRERSEDETYRIAQISARIMEEWAETESMIRTHQHISLISTLTDVRDAVNRLVFDGFISATPEEHLADVPRYLAAAQRRIAKAENDPAADDALAWQVRDVEELLASEQERADSHPYDPERAATLTKARWLIEELRVSLFAQQLGTRVKVSVQRIQKLLA